MPRAKREQREKGPIIVREGNATVRVYVQDRRAEGKGLAFHVADHSSGRRRLRTFADRDAAIAEAQRLARLLATGQSHAATFSNRDAAAYGQATALLRPTGVALETACAIFAEAVGIVGKPALLVDAARLYAETHAGVTAKPVAEAVREYVGTKEAQGASVRYLQDLRHRLGKLCEAFVCDVDAVRTPVLQAWMDGLKASPQTLRNFRAVLTGFFGFCRSRGWCSENPVGGVTSPKFRGDGEIETFSAEEFSKLLLAAGRDFLPCLALGGFCGLRSAEIERVHWEDVGLSTGEVVVRRGTAKTKSRRIVPLCDAGKAWLAPYANRTGPVWPGSHEDFYEAQQVTAEAAGIAWKPNGLRHGYASHRLAVTGDAVRVAHEMGNSAAMVHQHYKALVSESAGKAWFSITPERPANVEPIQREAAA